MKPRRRQRFVPAYKARRLARERSVFMLEMAQARLDAIVQWLDDREPREPGPIFSRFTTMADLAGQGRVQPPDEGTPPSLH